MVPIDAIPSAGVPQSYGVPQVFYLYHYIHPYTQVPPSQPQQYAGYPPPPAPPPQQVAAPMMYHQGLFMDMPHTGELNQKQYLMQMKQQLTEQLKKIEEALSAFDKGKK